MSEENHGMDSLVEREDSVEMSVMTQSSVDPTEASHTSVVDVTKGSFKSQTSTESSKSSDKKKSSADASKKKCRKESSVDSTGSTSKTKHKKGLKKQRSQSEEGEDSAFMEDEDDAGYTAKASRSLSSFKSAVNTAIAKKRERLRSLGGGLVENKMPDVAENDVVAMAADEEILITDVAEYLQLGIAFLSGGRTSEGFPIVTLPDCSKFTTVKDADFVRVMTYLVRIPSYFQGLEHYFQGLQHPSLLEYDKGFVILVDRRTETWAGVKAALLRIAGYFPGIIQCVYVLKPKGFLQKTLSDVRFKFIKDEFKFQIVLLDSLRDLHAGVDPTQLTEEYGGTLAFSLKAWIEDRMAIERFASNCKERSSAIQTLSEEFTQTALSNDEDGALEMLLEHRKRHMEVKDDLTSAMKYGQTLLSCMRRPLLEFPDQNPDKIATTCAIERLLVQLEETETNFEDLWDEHELKLSQCLELRRFENEFKQVLIILDNLCDKANTGMDIGDSVSRVQYLIKIHEELQNESTDAFDRATKLDEQGNNLIERNHYAVDCIRPKCSELNAKTNEISETIKKRAMVLERSLDLQQRIEKAQSWVTKGMKLLASQEMDKCQSKEGALQYLDDIKECLSGVDEIKLNNPKEFRNMFDSILTTEAKAGITEVISRMEDVKVMFEKRQESLKKVVAKCERPIQAVPATPVQSVPPTEVLNNGSPATDTRRVKNKRSKKTDRTIEIVRDNDKMEKINNNEFHEGEDTNSLSFKRRHVMNELLETEKMYVNELEAVLRGYIEEMENPDLVSFIPEVLHGKKDILFANWQELYNFHKSTFLADLQNYRNTPTLIGRCFVERKEELDRLYSTYCQNKPRSELLRRDCGNNNQFFQECQRSLGHKLPLGAYLLKPVQRITKYQLLLKEMLKYSPLEKGAEDLRSALECMLTVLKYVNDSMHQVAITGFPGKLAEQGKLLMQGALYVWVEHKKGGIKDIRQRKMQRHVFLYEKLVIFCKKRGDIKEKTCYAFKSSLKTAEVGLTEHVKGDKKKFELWLGGRVDVYTFLAPNENDKMAWVKCIRKALLQVTLESVPLTPTSAERKGSNNSLVEGPFSPSYNGSMPLPLPSPTPSEGSSIGVHEPMDDENDDVSWGSGEFSDGESEDEGLEGRKDVQSVQPVSMSSQYLVLAEYNLVEEGELSIQEGELVQLEKSISYESMRISPPPSPMYNLRPPPVSAKPHFKNGFLSKRIRRRSQGTTNKKNKWFVEECKS